MPLQLTQFQIGLLSLLAIAILLAFVFGILWIRRKYPKAERFNNFLIAFLLVAGLYLIAILAVAIGVYTEEELKKATPYFGFALIVFWLIIFIVYYWARRPIPTEKLWQNYVLPDVDWKWTGRVYTGKAYMPSIRYHKIIKGGGMFGKYDLVEVFFAVFKSHTKFISIQAYNKYTGECVFAQHNPGLDIVLAFLGKEALSSYGTAVEEIKQEKQEQRESEKGVYIRQ